jgi:hypothetical protein
MDQVYTSETTRKPTVKECENGDFATLLHARAKAVCLKVVCPLRSSCIIIAYLGDSESARLRQK